MTEHPEQSSPTYGNFVRPAVFLLSILQMM